MYSTKRNILESFVACLYNLLPTRVRKPTYNTVPEPQPQLQMEEDDTSPSESQFHANEHITSRNTIFSALHALPTELLLEIDSYLPSAPTTPLSETGPSHYKMALRATCRRFRAILPGPSTSGWTRADRRNYRNLLRQADFRALCAKEREGWLNQNAEGIWKRLVCCICRAAHWRDCFMPEEIKKGPESRMCIGSQGVLEICPHNRVTWAGVCLQPINMTCSNAYSPCGFNGRAVRVYEEEDRGSREVKVEVVLIVGAVSEAAKKELARGVKGRSAIQSELKMFFRKLNWRVCPHLHTKGVQGSWPYSFLISKALLPPRSSCGLRCAFGCWCPDTHKITPTWPEYHCTEPHCDTRIFLQRQTKKVVTNGKRQCKDFWVLKIERCLGDVRAGADGEKWMAQVVEASSLHEDRLTRDERRREDEGWQNIET